MHIISSKCAWPLLVGLSAGMHVRLNVPDTSKSVAQKRPLVHEPMSSLVLLYTYVKLSGSIRRVPRA